MFVPRCSVLLIFNLKELKDWLEKVIISIVLSVVIVPLVGLILNYTPFKINFVSNLTAFSILAIFSTIYSTIIKITEKS